MVRLKAKLNFSLKASELSKAFNKYLMLHGTLIPQPLLPQEKGSKTVIFLFPSPAGEGLGVRAVETST